MPAHSQTSLIDLLSAPSSSLPRPTEWSWPPRYTTRFIRECDQRLLFSAVAELGITVNDGNWFPFEVALTKRFDPLQTGISKSILTTLARVSADSSHTSIMHGGYQIHLDTFTCFWQGHPETKGNLEEMVTALFTHAPPFTNSELNHVAFQTIINCMATGTLDLPHLVYTHLHPEFVTLSCHASLREKAARRVALQQVTRGGRI